MAIDPREIRARLNEIDWEGRLTREDMAR